MEQVISDKTHVYKYKHINGSVLAKPVSLVEDRPGGPDEYFDSPYVVEWWIDEKETQKET